MTRTRHHPRWFAALAACLCAGSIVRADPSPPDPASLVPADVTLYVRIVDASSIRHDLDERPIAAALRGLLEGPLHEAWSALVRDADRTEAEVFDTWLGRDLTLVMRAAPSLPDALAPTDIRDWAVITRASRAEASRFVRRLNPLRKAPRGNRTVLELPEHALRVAGGAEDELFVIGPVRAARGLADEILDRLDDGGRASGSLAEDGGFRRLAPLDRTLTEDTGGALPAVVHVFARHDPFYGGWSVASARPVAPLASGRWTILHTASFEAASIFPRGLTRTRWAPGLLDRFGQESLITFIEPADIGAGPIDGYANVQLGRPLLSAELRRATRDVRLFVIGEVEFPGADEGPGLLRPALAVALPLTEPAARIGPRLDEHLTLVAEGVRRLGGGTFDVDLVAPHCLPSSGPRMIDLRPAMAQLAGDSPLLDTVTLNWQVFDAAGGHPWAVIASHPEHLHTVVGVLRKAVPVREGYGNWASCGVLNGQRLGVHLRSWSDHLAHLTGGDAASTEAFERTLGSLGALAGGVERLRWTLERPSQLTMDLTVQLQLRAPESSGPRASRSK